MKSSLLMILVVNPCKILWIKCGTNPLLSVQHTITKTTENKNVGKCGEIGIHCTIRGNTLQLLKNVKIQLGVD